jgi:hypothetical protein
MAEIDYSELDYSKMICNPMAVPPKKSPEDHYDIFQQYREFTTPTFDLDRSKLFRYIPLVYDKNSPLHVVIDDIKKLKGKAAELAGFKKIDGKYLESVEKLLTGQHKEANYMIIRYVVLHKSKQWHRFCILNEVFEHTSERLLRDPSKSDLQNFESLSEQIDTVKQDLLSKDNSSKLEEDMYSYYFDDKLKLKPEDIALNRKEGKDIV